MTQRIVLLQALAATPIDIARIVRASEPRDARRRPRPDAWSLAEIVRHLVDVETRYLLRLRRVVTEDQPVIPPILPDEAAPPPQATALELAQEFAAARAATMTYLSSLGAKDWQKQAVHQTEGETNLRYLVQHLVDHDTLHLSQMLEAKMVVAG
jgi:uncharacterized damage-inducible protein DinB